MTYNLTPRAVRIHLLRQRRDQLDAEIRTLEAAETDALDAQEYPDCGSQRAYMRHIRRGQHACRRCKDAHAAYTRETEAAR